MANDNVSPYNILFNWLFLKDNNYNVPKEVIESKINAKYILLNFINIPKICLFLNKYFNTYELHQIKSEDIFKELKLLCTKFNINKKDILYVPFKKLEKNKIIDNLKSKMIFIKRNELQYLYDQLYETDDDFKEFIEVFDILNTDKKIKKPKKTKKDNKSNINVKSNNNKKNKQNNTVNTLKSGDINNFDNEYNIIPKTSIYNANDIHNKVTDSINDNNTTSNNIISNFNNNEYKIDNISKLKIHQKILNEYYLVDVQRKNNKPLYILKNKKNNKKLFYLYNEINNFFFFINNKKEIFCDINDSLTKLININYDDFNKRKNDEILNYDEEIIYESDVRLEDKHSALYLRNIENQEDIYNLKLNILFFDIEVYTGNFRGFPKPEEAKFPINSISYSLPNNKIKNIFVLPDNNKNFDENEIIENMFNNNNFTEKKVIIKLIDEYKDKIEFKICKNEKELILEFLNDIKKYEYDIITAWNIMFDIVYIYNRMLKLKMNTNMLSPIDKNNSINISSGEVFYNNKNMLSISIDGLIIIDMLDLYKQFTFGSKESYSLSFIAQEELKDDKIKFENENLNDLYDKNLFEFLWYNIKDVDIIIKLNDKMKHIELINTFRIISKASFGSCHTTNSLADNLIINKLLDKNIIVRNFISKYIKNDKIPGAYVMTPKGGLYNFVIDLDFASLYPNIIRTFNIGHDTLVGNVTDQDLAYYYLFDRSKLNKDSIIKIEVNLFNGGNKFIQFNLNEFEKFIEDKILTVTGTIYYKHTKKKSLLFDIMSDLLNSRKVYKNKMLDAIENKDEFMRSTYNNIQLSFKTLANSIYGILLFSGSRWFNQYMGKSITQTGSYVSRFCGIYCDDYIQKMLDKQIFNENDKFNLLTKFKKYIFEPDIDTKYVIYMDTDSLYINLNDFVKNEINENDKVNKIIKEIAPEISNFLNNDIIKEYYLKDIFKIDNEYRSYLNLKQEVVAKTVYFKHNIKKKYAMRIINKEGKEVFEQDVKGLETKRSDFPNLTKIKLTKLLDLILEEKIDLGKINNFIRETQNEIMNEITNGNINIAKPVTFSKDFLNYKVIPQHIKGMSYWNELEYEFFLSGTKGYLFYLKGIDLNIAPKNVADKYIYLNTTKKIKCLNNLDVIVIPNTLKKLPEYYIIDKQRSIDFCWNERYDQLIGDMLKINEIKQQKRIIPTF